MLEDFFTKRNQITKSLGTKANGPLKVDIVPIEKGDRFLITSDGIHDNLTKNEIQEIVKQYPTIDEIVKNLIDRSLARSRQPKEIEMRAKPDDMSVVLVAVN